MTVVAIVVTVLLTVAAGLILVRLVRGPSILDRIIAADALLVTVICGIALEAAYRRDATTLPILVVTAVLGSAASVAVARFVARRDVPSRVPPPAGAGRGAADRHPRGHDALGAGK